MPRVYSKADQIAVAVAMAQVIDMRLYRGLIYIPVDYETDADNPRLERTVWKELDTEGLLQRARAVDMLFSSPQEFSNFRYMLMQMATREYNPESAVLIKHDGGLGMLTDMGVQPFTAGDFMPNYIKHEIIPKEDKDYKLVKELFKTISSWLNSPEQAHSLLHHLATALQPGWAAVKYVLLLGDGRNGKGTLLKMIYKLLGDSNISGVQRQAMAAQRPIMKTLNNKLANVVFDGPQQYIPESGPEKTVVAGEPLIIEIKFENEPFKVQTNALFIEALNKEPKSRDKSAAIQKRIVRFQFPNTYEDDLNFLAYMQSDRMIDALLTLLWEHWVTEDELAVKLKPSNLSERLQISQIADTSPVMAYLEDVVRKDSTLLDNLRSGEYRADTLADSMQPWLHTQGYGDRTANDIWDLLKEHFVIERVVRRENGRPANRRLITSIKPATLQAIELIAQSGKEDETDEEAVVRG
jgi:hypothetical protein